VHLALYAGMQPSSATGIKPMVAIPRRPLYCEGRSFANEKCKLTAPPPYAIPRPDLGEPLIGLNPQPLRIPHSTFLRIVLKELMHHD
jgi:hypothetical protein